MILDATAGNRTMWEIKDNPNIIFIDMERKLARKPTIFADNTLTPFLSNSFDTILYDPPHQWNITDNPCPTYPREIKKYYQAHKPYAFTYYGLDKYKSRGALLAHLHKASREFYRILKDDGVLWLKWNETAMLLRTIEVVFNNFAVIMRLFIEDPCHTAGHAQTYWLCMMKEKGEYAQKTLF